MDLTSLADSAYRQSAKADLGAVRAPAYKVRAAFEFDAAPTDGDVVSLYWAPSHQSAVASGNPGNVSGVDSAYTGYSSNADSAVKQLDFIGNFICTVQIATTVQVAEVGILVPSERYGCLVVRNESGQAFEGDAVESHVVFDPVYIEVQG